MKQKLRNKTPYIKLVILTTFLIMVSTATAFTNNDEPKLANNDAITVVVAESDNTTPLILQANINNINNIEPTEVAKPEPIPDRTLPIYKVYKNGYEVSVSADLQWYIHDLALEYNFDEKIIFAMILQESSFDANCSSDGCYGLAQIQKFWINGANISHFTEDYSSRDLLNPYDNILTVMEMWVYAREAYGIDTSTEQGMTTLLRWHNTGKPYTNSSTYTKKIFSYTKELIKL